MLKLCRTNFRVSLTRFIIRPHSELAESGNRTTLYDFHLQHGGKMVEFGGYLLPVQYSDQGLLASHLHTRSSASLFDVSHMLQTRVSGKDAISCFESICTADLQTVPHGSSLLTVFTNNSGGIYDDLIVTKVNDHELYIVSNAAMKWQDQNIMETAVKAYKYEKKDIHIEFLPSNEQSLIALQGPTAVKALKLLLTPNGGEKLDHMYFMTSIIEEVAGIPNCRITRCGYTGEDGVEISVPSSKVEHLAYTILTTPINGGAVKLAGLGARDSLRLEAGLCLYGSDINQETTPIEAGLAWLVAKRRRIEMNFPGATQITNQLRNGVQRRRVGLTISSPNAPSARSGMQILHNHSVVGAITSGCPSPSLKKNIAMGYIEEKLIKPGGIVELNIRNKLYKAVIARLPFIKSNYFIKIN